jgi:hypothetical protein
LIRVVLEEFPPLVPNGSLVTNVPPAPVSVPSSASPESAGEVATEVGPRCILEYLEDVDFE